MFQSKVKIYGILVPGCVLYCIVQCKVTAPGWRHLAGAGPSLGPEPEPEPGSRLSGAEQAEYRQWTQYLVSI